MAIILEGCDCTGKTTVAEKLSKKTGFEIVKGSSFEISQLDNMFEYMMNLLKKDVIIDRFYFSNLVYGDKYGYPMMKNYEYKELAWASRNSLVIYLYAPSITIKQRMIERGDDMISYKDIEDILRRYEEALYQYNCAPILSIDTSVIKLDKAVNMIEQLYKNI